MRLADFLRMLFKDGRIVFADEFEDGAEEEALSLLAEAFGRHRLGVAGPEIPFDPATALAAARFLAWACRSLIRPEASDRGIPEPRPPRSAGEHLSGDLTLRWLPQLYRRATRWGAGNGLSERLAETMRWWPLSGVGCPALERPLGDLEFGGHPGLALLYAERLAEHFRPAWMPAGQGRDLLELVWHELGRDPALLSVSADPLEE